MGRGSASNRLLALCAAALAVSGLATHAGTWLFTRGPQQWENAFYIARAMDSLVMLGCIVALAAALERRRTWARWLLCAVCVCAGFMQSMVAICGVAFAQFGGGSKFVGLCERTQQWSPIALVGAVALLVLISYLLDRGYKHAR